MTQADFQIALPEILLAVFAMAALLFGVWSGKDRVSALLTWATVGIFVAFALWIGAAGEGSQTAFGGMFNDDAFARFAKVAILLSAAAILAISQDYMQRQDLARFEYPILVTLSVVGMMVMVSAGDLMALYMGLELQSLALYVIAALRRGHRRGGHRDAGLHGDLSDDERRHLCLHPVAGGGGQAGHRHRQPEPVFQTRAVEGVGDAGAAVQSGGRAADAASSASSMC